MSASYTELDGGYAPADTFATGVEATNHRLAAGAPVETVIERRDVTAEATYGGRTVEVDVCLVEDVYAVTTADEILDSRREPAWIPTSLRYLYDDLGAVPDLLDTISVARRAETWTCQVVGSEEEITPQLDPLHNPHFITLTLRKA